MSALRRCALRRIERRCAHRIAPYARTSRPMRAHRALCAHRACTSVASPSSSSSGAEIMMIAASSPSIERSLRSASTPRAPDASPSARSHSTTFGRGERWSCDEAQNWRGRIGAESARKEAGKQARGGANRRNPAAGQGKDRPWC
eukprot:5573183-Pleurochrysis_carterae.AAC.1